MIGVFDSGSGGLTVLRALRDALPNQRFVYYGDHNNAPYGNRDAEEIYDLTVAALERLFALGCSLIVVACNTVAATALRRLQQTWLSPRYPDKRVIGVIVPMVEAMTGLPWSREFIDGSQLHEKKTLAIFATRFTVESKVFEKETAKRAPHVEIVQQACPRLARLIEENAPERDLRRAVRRYVSLLARRLGGRPLNAVLLGCTHYPFIADMFAEVLPAGVEILSQPKVTADRLTDYLERHPEFACSHKPGVAFYTSALPDQVTKLTRRFLGDESAEFRALS